MSAVLMTLPASYTARVATPIMAQVPLMRARPSLAFRRTMGMPAASMASLPDITLP